MKKSILEYVKQLVLIVFSVVLGILLSEKIQERKNEKEADLLLSKLKSELTSNKKLLDHYVPYHAKVVKNLDSLLTDDSFVEEFKADQSVLFKAVITQGNLMSDSPTNNAWEIAKNHPLIVHFDYEDVLLLSKIYNQQELTYQPVTKIIDLLLASDFNTPDKAKTNLIAFKNQMREVVTREEQLLEYIYLAEKSL